MAEEGNTASMHEALEAFVKLVDDGIIKPRAMGHHDEHCFVVVQGMARAALRAPPRNCDVGSPEEQYKRFKKFCFDNMGDGMNEPRCSKCPLGKSKSSCHFDFEQMTYNEESNGVKI